MGSLFSDSEPPQVTAPAPTVKSDYEKMMFERDTKTRNTPIPQKTAKDIVAPMIRDWETFSPTVYDDGYGNPTIGYGMTSLPNGQKVTWNTPSLTKEQAEQMLQQKIDQFTQRLEKFPTFKVLTPNQQAAVIDLAFTTGPNFDEKKNKQGKPVFPTLTAIMKDPSRADELKTIIPQIRMANGGVSRGLENRRRDTLDMFINPDYEYVSKADRLKAQSRNR